MGKLGVVLILWGLMSILAWSADIAFLESDEVLYSESERKFTAKGNVRFSFNDTRIRTQSLYIDVDTNKAWSYHPTTIKTESYEFVSSTFALDLNDENVTLTQINITVNPPGSSGGVYLKADTVIDSGDLKHGNHIRVTTCDLEKPHHYIGAKSYKYIPNQRLVMYNVWFYNQFFFIPIVLWSPIYTYALGERDIIWNFPVIGKKQNSAWDWYIQNTIDYRFQNNQYSSLYLDFFNPVNTPLMAARDWRSIQDRYIGWGIRHHYMVAPFSGMVYMYGLNFQNQDQSKAVLQNKILKLTNVYQVSPFLKIDTQYTYMNIAERINQFGKENLREINLGIQYNQLGDRYNVKLKRNQNLLQSRNQTYAEINRVFNDENRYSIIFNENVMTDLDQKNQVLTVRRNFKLPRQFEWQNHVKVNRFLYDISGYNSVARWSNRDYIDNKVTVVSTLTKPLNTISSIQISAQSLFDPDAYTSDTKDNNYLYKLPEISLKSKKRIKGRLYSTAIQFQQETIAGRYQEKIVRSQFNTQRIFPKSNQMSLMPNTFIFKQFISTNSQGVPLLGDWKTTLHYNQYIFKSPGKTLVDGDQMYIIKLDTRSQKKWLPFVKTTTAYKATFIDNDNNSPYYQINKFTYKQQELFETITLFYTHFGKSGFPYYINLSWEHKTGYNWLSDDTKWYDYQTLLSIDLTKKFDISFNTGVRQFNVISFIKSGHITQDKTPNLQAYNRYLPLNINTNFKYPKLTINHAFLMNINHMQNENDPFNSFRDRIKSSRVTLTTKIGRPEYEYQFNVTWAYEQETNQMGWGHLTVYHHQIQEISIQKNDHKRSLIVSYNKLMNKWQIRYEFSVFPKDPLLITKDRLGWRLEGMFNQAAQERFQ